MKTKWTGRGDPTRFYHDDNWDGGIPSRDEEDDVVVQSGTVCPATPEAICLGNITLEPHSTIHLCNGTSAKSFEYLGEGCRVAVAIEGKPFGLIVRRPRQSK